MKKNTQSKQSAAAQPHDQTNPEQEWFGFTRVTADQKTARVNEVFRSVASRYDLMNDLMSGGLHRLWKQQFVNALNIKPGHRLIDVAGGTGDIAFKCAAATDGKADIVVCDINPAMLEVGKSRALNKGWGGKNSPIIWSAGNAEQLPFPDRSADRITIAFGLRNVTRIDKALAEFYRVLKPGGLFACLEFSPGVSSMIKPIYDRYSFGVLPFLGKYVARDEQSYQYLAESIRQFPLQPVLAKRLKSVGFENVTWTNLCGGVAVIHKAWRT